MKDKRLIIGIIIINLFVSSCSLYIDSFTNNLNTAITSSNDPQTIMQALPAYIVLLDALVESDPQDKATLLASVNLMNAYSSLLGSQYDLVEDLPDYEINKINKQRKTLNQKALNRAEKAICIYKEKFCNLMQIKFNNLALMLEDLDSEDIKILYKIATAWVSWIQVNTDDWNAMAQIAQVKLLMDKIVTYDETIDNGNAHVYLGVLNSIIPATLGGKPELGKQHFESAISLSNGTNLMAKALYAEYYARLVFDEKLHNSLVLEILTDKKNEHGLINTLAIEKAKSLQRTASDYF
jgi:hypothetical protein